MPAAAHLLRRPVHAEHGARTVMLTAVAGRPVGPTQAIFMKMARARAWAGDIATEAAA